MRMNMINRTCDINLAAFLVTKGHKIVKMELNGREGRCYFVFDKITDEIINSYYDDAEVSAKKILANQKDLKTRIYNFMRK